MRIPGRRSTRRGSGRPADGLRGIGASDLQSSRRRADRRQGGSIGPSGIGRLLGRLPRPRLGRPSPVRAAALLGVVAAAAAIYGAAGSSAFALTALDLGEMRWTERAVLLETAAVPADVNVFRIETAPIEARIEALPAVLSAEVRIALPSTIRITVTEREPIMAWVVGETAFLVDRDGLLFAARPAAEIAGPEIRRVTDRRSAATALAVGGRLDPVDLDAAARLASLVPTDIGSTADELSVSVTDANGFVLRTRPATWVAIFGYYTASLRTTELIAGQARLLRSLLAGREAGVATIVLADDRNGTYVPATPAP